MGEIVSIEVIFTVEVGFNVFKNPLKSLNSDILVENLEISTVLNSFLLKNSINLNTYLNSYFIFEPIQERLK